MKMNYGLEVMTKLTDKLGNPQDKLKCIHVAGTNGKGSTIAFLSSILQCAGYKTGTFTSPALSDVKENIKIDDNQISQEDFDRLKKRISDCNISPEPSPFEEETAIAFLYFLEKEVDFAIIECGLGGRFDATNVIKKPLLALLTAIGLDHTDILGDSLEKITWHKEGIVKEGCEVVRASEVEAVVQKSGLLEQVFSFLDMEGLKIHLGGCHQPQNAALAAFAAIKLGIDKKYIYEGLERARWKGRFSVLGKNPLFIVDGAHNPQGVQSLKDSLQTHLNSKIIFVIGIFRDKAAEDMIRLIAPLAGKAVLIDMPENKRLLRAYELEKIVVKYIDNIELADSPFDAVKKALQGRKKDEAIVCFGSLSTINAVIQAAEELL